jgi:hypothetical protein
LAPPLKQCRESSARAQRIAAATAPILQQQKESPMSRPLIVSAALLVAATAAALACAEETKVVITVNRPQPDDAAAEQQRPFRGQRAAVDVAILLDTSNSMDGLINQAKSQLWTIVQQFAKAKKHGQTPVLRVALFEYGNTGLPAAEGYIRQVVPLTDDLDKLSGALFALSTNGGDEYCGQVIDEAITRLDWFGGAGGYKAIFIAGNEPFTQGPVDYRDACKRAIERGIVVNTIHCGADAEGRDGKWTHGAQLAEGESFNIDQDRAVVHIECPQDEIIIRLNAELNSTYLWYGARDARKSYAENQVEQDTNADRFGDLGGRAGVKASSAYGNRNRDLVDTLNEDAEILKKVKDEELPDAVRELPAGEREAYIKTMAAKRSEVQKKIGALAAEREAFLAKERQRLAADSGDATLGGACVAAIGNQLARCGFEAADDAK